MVFYQHFYSVSAKKVVDFGCCWCKILASFNFKFERKIDTETSVLLFAKNSSTHVSWTKKTLCTARSTVSTPAFEIEANFQFSFFLLKNEANFHINKFEKAHHRAVFSALEIFIENRGCFQCTFHINRNYILEGALLLSFSIVFLCKTRSLFLHHKVEMEHYFVFWVVTKS